MLKRWISLLLTFVMLLTMVPATALAVEPESLEGKTLSILGDSISTYTGVSNDKNVNATLAGGSVYYNGSKQDITRADTWWQQTVDALDMELLVNNSWSGSCIFPTRSGTVGAYVNRCVQLHNDKTGEEPDVIAVFLGTNDFYNFQSALGTADIDYDALITKNSDGTYAYAEPTTVCEGYAVMLHKMTERYPEAEVYCMNMLPTRDPVIKNQNVGQPTAFNADLAEIIENFGFTLVDLENCGIDKTGEVFDQYITDQYVHPGPKGMDMMTQALIRAMTGEEDAALCDITLQLNHVTADNEKRVALGGEAYANTLRVADGFEKLKVTVTMDGKDITETCVSGSKISIPDVTGDIAITASATVDKDPENYRWEFDGTDLVSVTTGGNAQNALTKVAGTCENGTLSKARYQLAEEVVLSPDRPWVVEWECSGSWNGLLLSSHTNSATKGMHYLYRSSDANRLMVFGEYTGSQYTNYGITLGDKISAPDANHVYRVENRIAADGSNAAYLLVDGVELGGMDDYYIGGNSNQNKNVNWVDGKTLVLGYMGTSGHPLNNLNLKYLQVWEGGEPAGEEEPVDLFVFAGQSNMMGAAVLEPETDTFTDKALEYKYMPKLRGAETGSFVAAQHPAGEFHYKDLTAAYGDKLGDLSYQSTLTDYSANTYFCPAMRNETKGFAAQSEADTYPGASLPPYFVTEYADYGHSSVYAHMAKGGVKITYYFTEEMATRYNALLAEYNAKNGSVYPALNPSGMSGAGDAFDNEYNAMLEDYAEFAPDGDVENKCFVWLQGEGDAGGSYVEYKLKMQVLWEHLQELGFSHFFVLRVGYWGNAGIRNVIKAQEDFCAENDNCYIVTRAPSLIPYPGATTDNWWISEPDAAYDDCRDSYVVNSGNHHFNEKAFRLFAERSAENVHRVLHLGQEPILEEENIQGMETEQPDEDEMPYTSYVGAEVFRNSLSVSKPSDTWTEQAQSSAGSTDLIPVKSTDSVWIQYVFFKSEAHAVGGFYDADGNLVAPLYYKQFGFTLDGNTGGISAFQTPETTNRVSIAEVEEATGKEIAFVRFTAWKASAGGHANTEARIYHKAEKLTLRYDDHYDVSGKTVEVIDAGKPTSYQVGYGVAENAVRDTAVVTLKGDTLVATGIGTAVVRIGDEVYNVTVEVAPISLLLLAGQSNMEGSEGNASQSIVCPDGMVYATYGAASAMNSTNATNYAASALTGQYRTVNVNGTTDNLSGYPVYALTEAGSGKIGADSGIAYEWVQQTGEKVWVVNAAHGGSAISTWKKGGANYNEAVALFSACQETLRKEIAAGHYTLNHMGYFWCQGCADETQTAKWYADQYLIMHEGLKTALAADMDSNSATPDMTLEFGGIIPIRSGHQNAGSYRAGVYTDTTSAPYFTSFKDLRMNGPRVAQYWMGSNPELTDIWNVCTIQEDWATMPDGSDGVAAYFRSQYNNGRVDYTTQVKQSDAWYTPTTPTAVHDSIHYNQIGYNEIGRESARNALIYLGETEAPKMDATVKFVGWDGFTEVTDVASSTVGSSGTLVVPMVSPVWKSKDVTYSVTAGLQYNYYDLLADAATTEGTLTAKGAQGGAVTATPKDPASYRWEFNGADLVSVTTGDNTQNTLTKLAGTITDGVFTDTRFRMSEPVVLRHDRPWVVEWKMTGNWTGMILSANDTSNAAGNTYLFKTSSNTGFLGFGEAGADGKYHNYGTLLGASVDFTQPHVYRVENRIAADGSNMAYLLLDGVEVGPMNRYYIGGNSDQNKNVNWVNGRDFVFGQIGTSGHTLTKGSLSYLTVMEDGERTPKNFRWEFDGNDLVSKGEDENDLKKLAGSSANGVFSNTRYQLEKAIILRHDLPWVMEWQGAGAGGFMLANGTKTNDGNNYFFHRANNTLEAFGYRNAAASMNYNYGVSLQSVLDTGSHKYRLENRIAADGSNMVYLTVDNQSAYRMDGFFHGGTAQGTTGDWISGQDFSFNYIGTEELPLTNYKLDYLTVVEDTGNVSQKADYRGKVISVLGDSISTFAGYIPVADGFNLEHLARYPQDNLLTDVNETWWMQVIRELDAKLGINDSWRGATVSGAAPVTTGTTGENAAMHNLTRIQNLGSNGTPDVILLYGGTNDLAHVSKVGTFDPDTAPSAAALTTTKWDNLADGFVHTLLRLQHYYPDAEIVAMLPTYTASYYSDEKLAQGNAVMTAICEHYGVPYVDLRDCGITTADLPDGIHPDAAGMDYITDAVLETLFAECEMTAGESTVYSVTHSLTGVKASLGHYKGISANQPFTETLAADGDMTVTVTMGGKDITASAYQNGVVSIPAVTGHVAITAKAAFSLGEHLQQLPGNVCCGSNLWQLLDHDKEYYTVNGWDVHASGTVYSVTVPVQAGEKVYASSFGAAGINGSTFNGIRVTFFGDYGVLKTMAPAEVYAEFSANGYLTAPAGTVAVNVPMWTNADSWELYLLDREHTYDNGQCSMCGDEMLRISLNELVRYQGGVNSLDGTLNTTFTNNWYSDIRIPEGAEQVRFLMFKTGGDWGSAFFKGSTYLSGVCDKTVGGYWKTLNVPEEATTLRYGYLYDEIATNAGYPAFEYLEFVGEDLTVQEDSGFMDRPATGCHSFSVKVNIAPAQGNPTGYAEGTDYGYIQLPTNYTSYGEPTRLIIVCHGAGANLATYQSNAWKNTNYSFWTDLGYAVMDMYASPAELTGNNSELHYGSPIVVDCYKEGYDYVMEHFNLKQDGVFLIGSSMGGLSSFQIAQSGEFPVIAQVGYCPAIDLFKQAYVNPWTTPSYQRSKIAAYFGFDGTAPAFTNSKYPSAAEIEYYKDNFAKTIPYSPILSNVVSGDLEKIFDVIPSSATASSAEEEALYQQLTATHPNPLMIFHNTDDGTVAYRYSKYFVDMVNRSGQEAVLRTFTSGAHNAWANGNSHTVQGLNGNITIKDSQYEAYLFFQKYEEHAEHIGWTDPAVAPTCTKSGLTEGSHCAVCGEILTAQQSVPATGVHTYENGVCTGCGEAEVLQGSIRLRSATLNLLDKVCIIYKASDDLIPTKDADVAERGVLLYDSAEKAASKDPALAYETVQLTYDPAEGRYVGQTEGIDARDMERSQFAVAYLKLRDGTYVFATREGVDQVQEYSPLIYCRNKMNDATVGKLCRAMMHYGAAAQVLQYGMTTGLMNEGFEAIPYDAGVLGTEVFSVDTTVINGMRLRSATMDLQGAISYIVKYEMTEDAAGKPLYAEYTLLGQQGSVELEYHAEENRWWATINGVPAKDLGAVLTVKPYWLDENGAKMYGGELVYSGNEYVRRTLNKADNPENLQALARAIAMYVHYADEYGN